MSQKKKEYVLNDVNLPWHELISELPELDPSDNIELSPDQILELKQSAKDSLADLSKKYEAEYYSKNKSQGTWLKTVLKSGTLTDKMAAMTLLIQDCNLYRLDTIEILLGQATKKGRRECVLALDTLKELFLTGLIPDRKMVPFHKRPLGNKNVTTPHLVLWYFEDALKTHYSDFVSQLDHLSHDSVLNTKKKAQQIAFELLCDKPECEDKLLSLIVNKLGDPENKIASNSTYLLSLLLDKHPAMKLIVVKELEMFLRRTRISLRAQYYATVFLNQVKLSKENTELSKRLLRIYFSMFKTLTVQHQNVETRMLGALLNGVNRAFPFAPTQPEEFQDQLDVLFKIVHIASFNKSTQALLLIYQVMHAQKNISDRFFRALYSKMLSPDLYHSSKQGLFMNVLYKAIRNDPQPDRVRSFIKRCLQICFVQKPSFACGMLLIISEILKEKPELKTHILEKEKNDPKVVYDPSKREPLFANATNCGWWELTVLSKHSHPSVAKWAQTLLEGTPVLYDGDPLNDFSIAAFLDKFVNKKPKKFRVEQEEEENALDDIEESNQDVKDNSDDEFDSIFEESDDEENLNLEKKLEKMLVDDEGLDFEEEEEDVGGIYGNIEDFQHLLESSGMESEKMQKQEKWEKSRLSSSKRKRKRPFK